MGSRSFGCVAVLDGVGSVYKYDDARISVECGLEVIIKYEGIYTRVWSGDQTPQGKRA